MSHSIVSISLVNTLNRENRVNRENLVNQENLVNRENLVKQKRTPPSAPPCKVVRPSWTAPLSFLTSSSRSWRRSGREIRIPYRRPVICNGNVRFSCMHAHDEFVHRGSQFERGRGEKRLSFCVRHASASCTLTSRDATRSTSWSKRNRGNAPTMVVAVDDSPSSGFEFELELSTGRPK